jgi:hypothetical protein
VPSTGPMQSRSPMRPPQSPPCWQRALSRAPPRRRRWLSLLRRKAEETRELHASSPGAGEGNCLRFVVIDTSHSDLTVSAVPRSAMRRGCLRGAWRRSNGPAPELQAAAASRMDCCLQSAAAHAHRWPSRPHRQHLFLAVREISGCDLRCGPLMSRDSTQPHIAAPPTAHSRPPLNAGGAPAACAAAQAALPQAHPAAISSAAIAIGAAAAARCSARRRQRMPPDRSQAEAVWTVRGQCWQAPTVLRARLCPDSRGPCPPVRYGTRARQANTTE